MQYVVGKKTRIFQIYKTTISFSSNMIVLYSLRLGSVESIRLFCGLPILKGRDHMCMCFVKHLLNICFQRVCFILSFIFL